MATDDEPNRPEPPLPTTSAETRTHGSARQDARRAAGGPVEGRTSSPGDPEPGRRQPCQADDAQTRGLAPPAPAVDGQDRAKGKRKKGKKHRRQPCQADDAQTRGLAAPAPPVDDEDRAKGKRRKGKKHRPQPCQADDAQACGLAAPAPPVDDEDRAKGKRRKGKKHRPQPCQADDAQAGDAQAGGAQARGLAAPAPPVDGQDRAKGKRRKGKKHRRQPCQADDAQAGDAQAGGLAAPAPPVDGQDRAKGKRRKGKKHRRQPCQADDAQAGDAQTRGLAAPAPPVDDQDRAKGKRRKGKKHRPQPCQADDAAPTADSAPVVVVAGLPRSGTSMVMQMLRAGGLPVWTDGVRAPDPDNPAGYLECEATKNLATDAAWLSRARGHAIKIITRLLPFLPAALEYRVILIRRPLDEVMASQNEMLRRHHIVAAPDDTDLAAAFASHLAWAERWLTEQPLVRYHLVDYHHIVHHPLAGARELAAFLPFRLDVAAMASAVDPSLYRQRGRRGTS